MILTSTVVDIWIKMTGLSCIAFQEKWIQNVSFRLPSEESPTPSAHQLATIGRGAQLQAVTTLTKEGSVVKVNENALYCIYFKVTCWRAAHEICGEPSTEYSSGLPQSSAHGQRLREHCPRFPCRGILQCWWSPYEMNDEKTGSLVHALFIQGCPGSFTCLSTEHRVQGTL